MNMLTRIPAETADTAALVQDRALAERLADGLAPKMRPIFADIHDEIIAEAGGKGGYADPRSHAELLARYCLAQSETIASLNAAEQQFQTRLANAIDEAEQRAAILDFAGALGADRKQLQSDRRAFGAWFDGDAVLERYHKRIGERERALAHALECLGQVAAEAIAADRRMVDTALFVDLAENLLVEMRAWPGDARVRRAAHLCLARIAVRIHKWPFGVWFETVLSATRRTCFDEKEDVWVQCAAFDALLALSPHSIAATVIARLKQPLGEKPPAMADNEMFLRRHLVRLVGRNIALDPEFPKLLGLLAGDESGVVRQTINDVLHLLPPDIAARHALNLRGDADPQVRAALFADVPRMLKVIAPEDFAGHIAYILRWDEDEFVLRVGLDAASALAAWCRHKDGGREHVIARLVAAVDAFRARDLSAKLMRWADEAGERIWLASDRDAVEIAGLIHEVTQGQLEAEIRAIKPLAYWLSQDRDTVGRVMAVLAQADFGLSLKTGRRPTIQRGEWIRRRLWRFLFEGGHSATDKRQAHIHTTGRHYHGTMLAPSARMAELAPTKVPGEPLVVSSEGGWRNYLPLIDQVLSALDTGRKIELFTSAGITEITPPKGLWRRARAFIGISRGFAALAELRNREPSEFLAALRARGIAIGFHPYDSARTGNANIAAVFADGEEPA